MAIPPKTGRDRQIITDWLVPAGKWSQEAPPPTAQQAREATMAQIYRSSLPFLFLQATGLAICVIFPDVVLWLPRQVYG